MKKMFSIDIEAMECASYAAGMAAITAKITLTEAATPDDGFSRLHMSERTLRLIHQALSKLVAEADNGALSVTTYPSLPDA